MLFISRRNSLIRMSSRTNATKEQCTTSSSRRTTSLWPKIWLKFYKGLIMQSVDWKIATEDSNFTIQISTRKTSLTKFIRFLRQVRTPTANVPVLAQQGRGLLDTGDWDPIFIAKKRENRSICITCRTIQLSGLKLKLDWKSAMTNPTAHTPMNWWVKVNLGRLFCMKLMWWILHAQYDAPESSLALIKCYQNVIKNVVFKSGNGTLGKEVYFEQKKLTAAIHRLETCEGVE